MCYNIPEKKIEAIIHSKFFFDYACINGYYLLYTDSMAIADSTKKVIDTKYVEGAELYRVMHTCGDEI